MFSPRSNLNLSLVAEQVNQKDKILEFLRARNFLNELKQNCIYFDSKLRRENESENFEPFLVNFHLRFGEVEDATILYLITKEPKQFKTLLAEIIFCWVSNFLRDSENVKAIRLEQIHCDIRFYDLPLISTYKFSLQSVHINCALTTFSCIVVSKSPVEQFTRQSVWKCQGCFGIPCIIRRNQESGSKAVSCKRCGQDCIENLGQRVTSNFCSVRVFETESFKSRLVKKSFTSSVELRLLNDLCQDLQLGHEYLVIGNFEPRANFYNVWNILVVSNN